MKLLGQNRNQQLRMEVRVRTAPVWQLQMEGLRISHPVLRTNGFLTLMRILSRHIGIMYVLAKRRGRKRKEQKRKQRKVKERGKIGIFLLGLAAGWYRRLLLVCTGSMYYFVCIEVFN